eukprot:Tamp_30247.p2 GENE.Tamp_30247~~Tamp_30247.p2  ORF type:complete len:159 (-),score=19.42 Tamp_30247:120-596(-)
MGGSQSRSRARDEGPPKHGKTAPRSMGPQTGASGHTAAPAPGPRGAARAGTGSRVDQLKKKAPPPALSDFRSPGQVRTPVASSSSYYSQNLASALSFDPRSPGLMRTPPNEVARASAIGEKVAFVDPRSPNVPRTPLLAISNRNGQEERVGALRLSIS